MLQEHPPNAFPLPPCTQTTVEYTNLKECEQHARVNFKPTERQFKRVPSAQENEWALRKVLQEYWGFNEFRDRQLEICMEVMRGNDVFVNAPTGLGKSVCFQLPAVTLQHGITIVIVPLIALMHDQIDALRERGLEAASLCSSTPPAEVKEVKRQLAMGHPKLRLLYTTPETLFGKQYEADFRRCHRQKQIVRLVIDEAHVIDDWGWAFRPEFRQLGRFRQNFPNVPISAFTASARSEAREHICQVLGIKQGHYAQFVFPVNRKNLFYEVKHRGSEDEKTKIADVVQTIKNVRAETERRGRPAGVGIVYCAYVATCGLVCEQLREAGISAETFHAKLSDQQKTGVQEAFKHGRVQCIVATIAFGMGIDKADVRYVIHFQCPTGIESYYQETGRAGRDGHMSRCIIYYSRQDASSRRSMIQRTATTALNKCEASGQKEAGENFARRYTNSFKSLQQYAESTTVCRHIAIARYFEESNIDQKNPAHLKAYCDKMCDVCVNPAAVFRRATNITEDAPVASQIVPAPERQSVTDLPSSDISLPASLAEVHNTALILKSPPSTRTFGSLGNVPVRTPVPIRPSVMLGSAANSVVPSPHLQPDSNPSPRTPAPIGPVDRKGKRAMAMTIQDFAEGSYAIPDAPPATKKKREQQHDKFMATEAVQGDGPYGYYAASSSSRPRSQARPTSFKTPFRKEREHVGDVTILADHRARGLSRLLESLKPAMLSGSLADRVWAHLCRATSETKGRRRKIVNSVAQAYEAALVQRCDNQAEYERHLKLIEKILPMLSTEQGVHALTSGELQQDHGEREEVKILLELGDGIGRYGR